MNQQQSNQAWQQEAQTNVGSVTFLVPPQRNSGLRKPYQYKTTTADFTRLKTELKTISTQFGFRLQCDLVDTKPVKYGSRLDCFLLGYAPGYVGGLRGITREEWEKITTELCARLKQSLGDDVSVYVEPWTAERKFQARFETYVMFAELEP